MTEKQSLTIELLKIISPIAALFLTWFVGVRILHTWEIKRKKKELDILMVSEFYKHYGEFSSIWRLWKVYHDNNPDKITGVVKTDYWKLLERAANVEGGMEAIFVKLASEKKLNDEEIKSLGLFRQAIQQLRQSIREYDKMDWQREHREYISLKKLSIFTARLINKPKKYPKDKNDLPSKQLSAITIVDSDSWKKEVGTENSSWSKQISSI
jgi:hypothetical protein